MHAEVRMARIVEAVGLYRTGKVTCEAASWLGMSKRHFRRLRDRYETEGAERIIEPAARPGFGPAGAGGSRSSG